MQKETLEWMPQKFKNKRPVRVYYKQSAPPPPKMDSKEVSKKVQFIKTKSRRNSKPY